MNLTIESILQLGLIQDETIPEIFSHVSSYLEFRLINNCLYVGQDLRGPISDVYTVFFKITSTTNLQSFLGSIDFDGTSDFLTEKKYAEG